MWLLAMLSAISVLTLEVYLSASVASQFLDTVITIWMRRRMAINTELNTDQITNGAEKIKIGGKNIIQ